MEDLVIRLYHLYEVNEDTFVKNGGFELVDDLRLIKESLEAKSDTNMEAKRGQEGEHWDL